MANTKTQQNALTAVPVRRDPSIRPTQETYDALQDAYDYFNQCLFEDTLPNCVITLKNRPRSYGYFSADRYTRHDGQECDEVSMNLTHFQEGSLADILSTLVHEMVHLWQHHHGKPGRGPYHNRQWADKMKEVGLYPSNTGLPGGKETGDSVLHYIIGESPFDRAVAILVRRNFIIPWAEIPTVKPDPATEPSDQTSMEEPKPSKRVKFICPVCKIDVRAEADANLGCLADNVPLEPVPS